MTPALIVFAKVPEPGAVKTRLCPPLAPEQAAALYDAMLRDALEAYAGLDVAVRLYLAPSGTPVPPDLVPAGVSIHTQQGDGLGARMRRAFLETFLAGHQQAAVIGTDHPTLPLAFVEMAFEAVREKSTVAIGPSEDGGYYLLAMHGFFPALFEGMSYSHADVFAQTLDRATMLEADVTVLPLWYDVDDAASFARLKEDLEALPEAAPRTRRLLGTDLAEGMPPASRL